MSDILFQVTNPVLVLRLHLLFYAVERFQELDALFLALFLSASGFFGLESVIQHFTLMHTLDLFYLLQELESLRLLLFLQLFLLSLDMTHSAPL